MLITFQKSIKNHAAVLQFFLTYLVEQNKYESTSNKNVYNLNNNC